MRLANYITDHDAKIANKLAYVINGGDLSYAAECYGAIFARSGKGSIPVALR